MHAKQAGGEETMLTRSRARAANKTILVDDNWSDAYIQTKDEQIDAKARVAGASDWSDASESDSDDAGDSDDADVWRSDDDANADSDDDESEGDDEGAHADEEPEPSTRSASRFAGGGFAENVCWTVLSVLVVPLALYAAAFKRRDTPWPLCSASATGTLVKVLANLLVLSALALVGYGAACSERAPSALHALLWRNLEINSAADCSAAFLDGWHECLARGAESVSPLCARALAQGSVLALVLLLAAAFHRFWLKALLLLAFVGYFALNAALELQAEQRAAVKIVALDPTFAFANESIFVAIDGQNLAQGGIIAWVPYWGGLHELKAHKCAKLFPEPLRNGGVLVTFDHVNEYVPCYAATIRRTASSAEASAAFRCFEGIRLRVKDLKSVPGWSLQAGGVDERAPQKSEL